MIRWIGLRPIRMVTAEPLPVKPTEDEILAVAARAIMTERARCAKIAADFPNMGAAMGREIAAVIRAGGEP